MKQTTTEKITRNEVAALDIATHTGFYCVNERGTWDFTESMRRNNNKQHKAFRDTLIDFIKRNGIKQIVAEDVSVNNHFTDTRKLSEFRGILFEVCDTLDLPEPHFINPASLKKFATGDGKATKEKMIEFCKLRWQIEPGDDNEADAINIFFCYIKRFNLYSCNSQTIMTNLNWMAESTKRFLKDTLESFFDYWIQIQSHLMKESELSS